MTTPTLPESLTEPAEPRVRGSALQPEALVAMAFAVAAIVRALLTVEPDDEGYLTYLGAATLADAPLASLFFQKFHPTLSLVMAPVAALGFRSFLVAHALMAAAAVYLVGATGRRWWGSTGWVAAPIVALSPLMFVGASSGHSNTSGVFFVAWVLYLSRDGRWRWAAGFVLGAALWTRYEAAAYLLGWLTYETWRTRDPRMAIAAGVAPVLYAGAGAIYHGDVLWMAHYPPALVVPGMPSTIPEIGGVREFARLQIGRFTSGSPAFWLALALPAWRVAETRLRVLVVLMVATIVVQTLLPVVGGVFNYDFADRYVLNHLTFAALAASGVLATWTPGRRVGAFVPAAIGAFGVAAWPRGAAGWLDVLPLGVPVALARATASVAVKGTLAACAVVLVGYFATTTLLVPRPSATEIQLLEALATVPPEPRVVTNIHAIDMLLESRGIEADVFFLPGYDMVAELGTLMHAGGHRQAPDLIRALTPRMYGRVIWPCEFPTTIPADTVIVLSSDDRVSSVFAVGEWLQRSGVVLLSSRSGYSAYRTVAPLTMPAAPTPEWMDESVFQIGCERVAPQP